MMHYAYLGSLLAVIAILLVADWRLRLAFFYDWQRTAKTLATAVGFFLVWDILGVALKIFFPGNSPYALHVMLLPRVPLEELFFLSMFTYVTLLLWRGCVHLYRA